MQQKLSFEEWKKLVDRHLENMLGGLDSECLPDAPYRRWYDEGKSPLVAAAKAIRHAEGF